MRFPYVAFSIKPNANEMYMQRKWFYLYYTLFFLSELNTLGVILKCYALIFPKHVWLVGIQPLLSVPNTGCVAFSDPTQL